MRTNYLGKIILEKTGKSVAQLVEEELNIPYANFSYRARKGKIHIKDYLFISRRTGVSLDILIASDPKYKDIIKAIEKILNHVNETSSDTTLKEVASFEEKSKIKQEKIPPHPEPVFQEQKDLMIGNEIVYL